MALLDQREVGGELAAAEVGPLEAAAVAGAAVELVEVLGGVGLAGEDVETGLDDVGDVAEDGRGALLAILLDVKAQAAPPRLHRPRDARGGDLAGDLVAAERREADRVEHVNPVDPPADLRLPVDRLDHAAGGGGVMTS